MNHDDRVKIGLIGLTGYGAVIRRLLEEEKESPEGRTTIGAVFAPDADQHVETIASLKAGGATVCSSYDEVLASDVEAVWLPVPIDLHRSMAEQALSAGKAVMLEKPVAGCIDDHDAIARAAKAAGLPVGIGFQDIYRENTLPLKRRLLAGDFGTPLRASTLCLWPRSDDYYARSSWAGTVKRNGIWVLDSAINNASAHFVNLALFLLGPSDGEAAELSSLRGETLRGRPTIEYADTFSLRASLKRGIDVVVNMTHATSDHVNPRLAIDTDRGTLRVFIEGTATWTPTGGEAEPLSDCKDGRWRMARRFARLVRGEDDPDTAVADPETSRPHGVLVSAAAQACPIVPVPAEHVAFDEGGVYSINGLGAAMQRAFEERKTLSELGDVDLPLKTGSIDGLETYDHLEGLADS